MSPSLDRERALSLPSTPLLGHKKMCGVRLQEQGEAAASNAMKSSWRCSGARSRTLKALLSEDYNASQDTEKVTEHTEMINVS